jgi:hypothetical protein
VERPLYVYGVLSASDPHAAGSAGVQGAEVERIECGPLAALASPVQVGELRAREIRAHWRVLEEASKEATVLPVRFGTVMESKQAVCEQFLDPNAERVTTLLRRVAGCVQLNIKGNYDEDTLMREVVCGTPHVAALRERVKSLPEAAGYYESIRLGELVANEVAHRRDDDTRAVLAALEPLAVAATVEQASHQNAAFSLSFLVARDAQARFSERVVELADELGDRIELRYIGPLPPYSFADGELAEESSAWA